ncbi:MAG: PDDEXK nuclease domain-containing protein [Bacteroidota bacterium]
MNKKELDHFQDFLSEVKAAIQTARLKAMRAVNTQLIELYWNLGRMIVERQEQHSWGKSVVEKLSKELKKAFPSERGYSSRNLWNMREFYVECSKFKNLQPLVAEISWTKNIIIFQKCKDALQREFYIKMTKKYGWTKNVLIHQIENQSYEKFLLNQTSFEQALPDGLKNQTILAVKDEYVFDFLELSNEHSEYELEQAILRNIRAFLIEMGGDFAFIGNQYHLKVGQKDYSIDLLLFHRKLRCLVAIDLKIGEFEPEHKGKMEFYLTALNEQVKYEQENDAIGIVICKSKDRTVVEYALKTTNQPIGVSTYVISSNLPKDFKDLLPSPEAIRKRLEHLN